MGLNGHLSITDSTLTHDVMRLLATDIEALGPLPVLTCSNLPVLEKAPVKCIDSSKHCSLFEIVAIPHISGNLIIQDAFFPFLRNTFFLPD